MVKEEEINKLLTTKLPTKIRKEVKVQSSKTTGEYKQYSIKLPQDFVEELKINKGDIFIIEYNSETGEYSIKLKKEKDDKKTTSSNR